MSLKNSLFALFTSRFALWVVYPGILLVLWVSMVLFMNPYSSFSTLIGGQRPGDTISGSTTELLAGEKISGEFTAHQNYLGIVVFNVDSFNRTNSSSIVFHLKEKGSKNWEVNNTYKVDRFETGRLYPFGFPAFSNSQGKTYEYEIVSIDGNHGNAIAISHSFPFILKEYVIPHAVYRSSKIVFLHFIVTKILNSITYIYLAPISLIYLLPLIIYVGLLLSLRLVSLIWPQSLRNILKIFTKRRYYMVPFLFLFMLINIFFIPGVVDLINFEIILLWIIVTLYYRLSSAVHFFTALILFLMIPPLVLLNNIPSANKIAIQIYFLLVAGVLVGWYEVLRKPKTVALAVFLKKLVLGKK